MQLPTRTCLLKAAVPSRLSFHPWSCRRLLRTPGTLIRNTHSSTADQQGPLKILFCGSDDFSITSLRALHDLSIRKPDLISSLSIVTRPPKPYGRGLKSLRYPPITPFTRSLAPQIALHEIDTFTGWTPPETYNLIVAVSFGLLIPPRILNAAKYGGLNVHPSLLPDLKGPAPIQWAIMYGDRFTGVSLQTLHPRKFDGGKIVDQSAETGIEITRETTTTKLSGRLAKEGAKMLVNVIEKGLDFGSPPSGLVDGGREDDVHERQDGLSQVRRAPKITPADREIVITPYEGLDSVSILRRDRAIGPLWNDGVMVEGMIGRKARCKFFGWRTISLEACDIGSTLSQELPIVLFREGGGDWLVGYRDIARDCLVTPGAIILEGQAKIKTKDFVQRTHLAKRLCRRVEK